MKFGTTAPLFLLCGTVLSSFCSVIRTTEAYGVNGNNPNTNNPPTKAAEMSTSRRSWLKTTAAATAASLLLAGASVLVPTTTSGLPSPGNGVVAVANAAEVQEAQGGEDVYFGVGCFWHIQHEFVQAERDLLGRDDHKLTSAAGYAGGKATDKEGRVCYHNMQFVADYGKLGHGEVVGMKLPADKIVDFAAVYFSLFNPRTKDRVDPQDKGGEYRSLIGLKGGTLHPAYPKIEAVASEAGFQLKAGQGNDPDTLGKQLVYVYDTDRFPFYQAEVYHQYHNDFQSPAYGKAYNQLADLALEEGRIHTTGCPDRV